MWFNKTSEQIFEKLNTNLETGLTLKEVENRREKYGYNTLKSAEKKSIIKLFIEQLNDILIYILLGAAIVSGLLGEISDAIIIGIVLILNAVIGVIQEFKAEKALDALKQLSTPKALVKRDGKIIEIPSEEVVPGDIVLIDAGRYIPCDLRLVETANLKIEESALTGESVPIEKNSDLITQDKKTALGDQKNMAFMSTLSTYGRGIGIAVATGMDTEIGKIASMLEKEGKELTPLQKKLNELGKLLGIATLIICALMFLVALIQKRNLLEMFLTSISLAVAAIPEGLPAIVTIVLAMGVQKMIKENAIIRKLPAVETLGAVNIICSDKTGTLTQNKMTVTRFLVNNKLQDIDKINLQDSAHKLLLENIVLCNDSTYSKDNSTGDPTEIALVEVGFNNALDKSELENAHKRIFEIPFESDRKLMTTVNKYDSKYYVMTKGATDNLINICSNIYIDGKIVPFTKEIKENILKYASSMSEDALRVLGSAFKTLDSDKIHKDSLEKDLTFIGLVGMIDPPRESVKKSIEQCKQSSIKPIMITGDHKITALAIAKNLGIAEDESEAIFGYEIDEMSDEELSNKIDTLKVFARVSPEHKVKIVKALKKKGNIVSMTGDGVNDAPSLKAADIGVAMGITGTDVAKGASDMVLTDDNFSTIVSAIEEGRNIFNNIKKSIVFLLSCNMGELLALFIGILLGWPAPLRPIHLLWVNLITDSLPALSLGIDPGDPDVMKEKPRNPKENLFAGNSGISIILNGLLIGALTLIAFETARIRYSDSIIHAQTMAFVVLSISQLFHSLNMRNTTKSIFQVGLFTNKYLIASILFGIFLQNVVVTVPFLSSIFKAFDLTSNDWIFVAILSIIPLILNEIVKFFLRLKNKNN
ncbi:calcium-transporting P-type ATPase, PMR1-type [Clostridium oceanicum]|uniref:P-type Ca(2+) transporter n=1 Tax=Clostridium oceanicum TaxID=1543 RepID=A0ABN1JGP2_9CLOT